MNSCNNCRWLNIETYAGVGRFYCKLHYKENPIYSKIPIECSKVRNKIQDYYYCKNWEQGGLKGLIKRIKTFFKKYGKN